MSALERTYKIGPTSLVITIGDITLEKVDAIVNAANCALSGGAGVNGAIQRAAGPELLKACGEVRATLPGQRLATGRAIATPAFRLAAKYVIHAVGPIYDDAPSEAPRLLASCYTRALALCRELEVHSVAFPAISTGIYGYPVAEAASVSLRAIRVDLARYRAPELARMVLFDEPTFRQFVKAAEQPV